MPDGNRRSSRAGEAIQPDAHPGRLRLLEELDGDPPVEVLERPLPERRDPLEFHRDRLRTLEDSILEDSLSVLEGVVRFAHIPPDAEEAPEEWVREHGQEKAERLFRLAGYGLMASAKAPVGIKTAKDVATGILKARATERLGPRTININTVVMPEARVPQYERKKIE